MAEIDGRFKITANLSKIMDIPPIIFHNSGYREESLSTAYAMEILLCIQFSKIELIFFTPPLLI